ncbi:MAG TPA: ATP-binding cassette domain-containing protein [Chitinophagaceae bacterium]|nr:ATP-binding cassette domain-containing protein [Chitinophagaceae bacterium]
MKIELTGLGKRFNKTWIFRNLSFQFTTPNQYAITGPNGSGKSTLLQIIAGTSTYNEGSVDYKNEETIIHHEHIFKNISLAAPYLELVEEMTLTEFFLFHRNMKGWIDDKTDEDIISHLGLQQSSHKQLRYFSSGMKQRVKLAQAIFSNVPVIFLDEPATNLDEDGVSLYRSLIRDYCSTRLIIISSNDKIEYDFCDGKIDMMNYK